MNAKQKKQAVQTMALACLIIGRNELANQLSVDGSSVSRWKLGRALVPVQHCARIEAAVIALGIGIQKTQVTADKLRPDYEFTRHSGIVVSWRERSKIIGGGE